MTFAEYETILPFLFFCCRIILRSRRHIAGVYKVQPSSERLAFVSPNVGGIVKLHEEARVQQGPFRVKREHRIFRHCFGSTFRSWRSGEYTLVFVFPPLVIQPLQH